MIGRGHLSASIFQKNTNLNFASGHFVCISVLNWTNPNLFNLNSKVIKFGRCYVITLPLGKGIPDCLDEVESGSRLDFNSVSFTNYVAASGKILLGLLTVSPLHYFNCSVVYTLPKIASVFFVPCACKLCLSSVLWRPCLLLHDPCADAPGRTRKSVPLPLPQSSSDSTFFWPQLFAPALWQSFTACRSEAQAYQKYTLLFLSV